MKLKVGIFEYQYDEAINIINGINEIGLFSCSFIPTFFYEGSEIKSYKFNNGSQSNCKIHLFNFVFSNAEKYKILAFIRKLNNQIYYFSEDGFEVTIETLNCSYSENSYIIMNLEDKTVNCVQESSLAEFVGMPIDIDVIRQCCEAVCIIIEHSKNPEQEKILHYYNPNTVLDIVLEILRNTQEGKYICKTIASLAYQYLLLKCDKVKIGEINNVLKGVDLECVESIEFRNYYKSKLGNITKSSAKKRFLKEYTDLLDILDRDYISFDDFEIICNVVSLLDKYNQVSKALDEYNIKPKNEKESKYIGKIGEIVVVDVFDIKMLFSKDNNKSKYRIYKIIDKNGNIIIYKGTIDIALTVKSIRCRISAHEKRDGIKQTIVKSVKVLVKQ